MFKKKTVIVSQQAIAVRWQSLPLGGEEAGLAAEIVVEAGGEAVGLEEGGGLEGEGFVDFEGQQTVGSEVGGCVAGYGAVEAQRVIVGDKEGQVRVVVEHIAAHQCLLALANVGGIADDEVETVEGQSRGGGEKVVGHEVDVGAIVAGVVGGHGERLWRDVEGIHVGLGEEPLEGYGYAAAASAEVEHRVGRGSGCDGAHYLLRFGSGDEHIGVHPEAASAEVGVANDVLYGALLLQVGQRPVEAQQVALVDRLVEVEQHLRGVHSEKGLAEHGEHGVDLFRGVERGKHLAKPLSHVAQAVGGEGYVACVHRLFAAKVGGYFPPQVGVPLEDGGGVGVVVEPCLGAANEVVEGCRLGVERQFGATLLGPYPALGGHRVGVERHADALLLEICQPVDYGKKLADIVGAEWRLEVEQLLPRSHMHSLILHHAGVAAAGGIHSEGVELWHGQPRVAVGQQYGHALGIHAHHLAHCGLCYAGQRGLLGRGDIHGGPQTEGLLGLSERFKALELGAHHALHLPLAFLPSGVDAGTVALPHHIVFLFLFAHSRKNKSGRTLRPLSHVLQRGC